MSNIVKKDPLNGEELTGNIVIITKKESDVFNKKGEIKVALFQPCGWLFIVSIEGVVMDRIFEREDFEVLSSESN